MCGAGSQRKTPLARTPREASAAHPPNKKSHKIFYFSAGPRAEMKGGLPWKASEGPQKTSKPGSKSVAPGFESPKPDPESLKPSHVHERPIPRKCSWCHLDPKSLEMTLLSILFEAFLEGFRKAIFPSRRTPPAPKPSTRAVEPSHETVEPSADAVRPSSETAEPRPAHGQPLHNRK